MLHSPKPSKTDMGIYFKFITHRKLKKTKAELNKLALRVKNTYNQYKAHQGNAKWLTKLTLSPSQKSALQRNYLLTYKNKPMADLRADILAQAIDSICPLCGTSQVSTLDHYLPKASFPELAVLPRNLVPCCERCNRLKNNRHGATPNKQFIHAYFHKPKHDLLTVNINSNLSTITFKINQHSSHSPDMLKRAENHFQILELANAYLKAALIEISDRKETIKIYYDIAPGRNAAEVKKYFNNEYLGAKNREGCYWKAVLFLALSNDITFCDGGFLNF
jgi:5-methylcytosine-specific restriction endonuclease McrA